MEEQDKSKEAANRVKDITGVLQLKSKLSAEKDKINKAYITLGKAYYDRHEGELEGKFADEFHTIQAGLVKIASLEDEIAELEGTRVCAECGAKVEKNAAFCSRCGAPMDSTTSADVHEPEEPEEMQETIFEEKDETAAGKAVDNAETEGTAGPDADSADASARFKAIVDRFGDNPAAMKQAGIAYATEQIIDLIANHVNGIHVYSMNKPDVAAQIKNNLSEIL